MKQAVFVLLAIIMAIFTASCRYASTQPPETFPDGLTWERLLYKKDLAQFEIAAFSSDGERFIISDGYRFIRLWQKPFSSPPRDFAIQGYGPITALQSFGDQQDIFFTEEGGLAQIWDRDLQIKKFEYRFAHPARRSAITADGRFIAADGGLYDRRKKSLIGRGVGHAFYTGACFGGGSLLLTAGFHDQRIAVRNIYSGEFEYRGTPYPITGAGLSPNEKYAVAVTNKGRCYLWHWPDQEPRALVITREDSYFVGFSPDSKWFVVDGSEFLHIFRTDPPGLIARLQPVPAFTSVHIASNNLIAMGDDQGDAHIYDVSAGRMIARQRVCEHAVGPVEFVADKGYLWAASSYYDLKDDEPGEIALYHIKGLEPYIEPPRLFK